MKLLLIAMPGDEALAARLATDLDATVAELELRRFPDQETYVRIKTPVRDHSVAIVCSLKHPDGKFLPLAFTAAAARDLGATRVGLVAPYLSYLRQDKRFRDGEAITSVYFARLISDTFDWLLTVDPHLHRFHDLGDIYRLEAANVHAAPLLANWIKANIDYPLVIGPDAESEQWVSAVAARADAPHLVLTKERLGDRNVRITAPDLTPYRDRQPVLVDDIVSSGHTIIEAARLLAAAGLPRPIVVAVHAVLNDEAYATLQEVGLRLVTTNTIPHATNGINASPILAEAIARLSYGKSLTR